jgi:hypothetical protein
MAVDRLEKAWAEVAVDLDGEANDVVGQVWVFRGVHGWEISVLGLIRG